MNRSLPCALLLVLVLFPGPVASEEGPDTVVLHTGERLACRIQAVDRAHVTARVGDRTYRFERRQLQAVERDGKPLPSAEVAAFLQAVVPFLGSAQEDVAASAHAALRGLDRDETTRALFRRAAAGASDPKVREKLTALAEAK